MHGACIKVMERRMVFKTDIQCVYCAVRLDSLSRMQGISRLYSCSFAQVVSRRPLTAEARVQSQFSPRDFFGSPNGKEKFYSPSTSIFPVSIIQPILHIHLYLRVVLNRRANGWNLGNFQKVIIFRTWGNIREKRSFTALVLKGFKTLCWLSKTLQQCID